MTTIMNRDATRGSLLLLIMTENVCLPMMHDADGGDGCRDLYTCLQIDPRRRTQTAFAIPRPTPCMCHGGVHVLCWWGVPQIGAGWPVRMS